MLSLSSFIRRRSVTNSVRSLSTRSTGGRQGHGQQQQQQNRTKENPSVKEFHDLKAKTERRLNQYKNNKSLDVSMHSLVVQQLLDEWVGLVPKLSERQQPRLLRNAAEYADSLARSVLDVNTSNSEEAQPERSHMDIAQKIMETIRTWVKLGDAQKAESLLERLVEIFEQTDKCGTAHRPLGLAYASVIDAWSKDTNSDKALARALYWFNKLDDPPMEAYNSMLNAYGNRGLAIEATKFLRDMQGKKHFEPCVISFATVMKAWVRSKRWDTQKNIDKLLEELKKTYEAQGRPSRLMPNAVVYGTAMSLASPERGQALLQEIQEWYERTGNPRLAPTARHHYMRVMKSWAKAGNPKQAERLLMELLQAYQAGNENLRPGYQVSTVC
jgi:pentatricopeptide repeat protein